MSILILFRWFAGKRKGLRFVTAIISILDNHPSSARGYLRKELMDHQPNNPHGYENLDPSLPLWIAHSKISQSQPPSLLSWFLWDPIHRYLSIFTFKMIYFQTVRNPYLRLIYFLPQCISQIDFYEKDYSLSLPRL